MQGLCKIPTVCGAPSPRAMTVGRRSQRRTNVGTAGSGLAGGCASSIALVTPPSEDSLLLRLCWRAFVHQALQTVLFIPRERVLFQVQAERNIQAECLYAYVWEGTLRALILDVAVFREYKHPFSCFPSDRPFSLKRNAVKM